SGEADGKERQAEGPDKVRHVLSRCNYRRSRCRRHGAAGLGYSDFCEDVLGFRRFAPGIDPVRDRSELVYAEIHYLHGDWRSRRRMAAEALLRHPCGPLENRWLLAQAACDR